MQFHKALTLLWTISKHHCKYVHSYLMFVRKYASGSSNRMGENDELMLESMLIMLQAEQFLKSVKNGN